MGQPPGRAVVQGEPTLSERLGKRDQSSNLNGCLSLCGPFYPSQVPYNPVPCYTNLQIPRDLPAVKVLRIKTFRNANTDLRVDARVSTGFYWTFNETLVILVLFCDALASIASRTNFRQSNRADSLLLALCTAANLNLFGGHGPCDASVYDLTSGLPLAALQPIRRVQGARRPEYSGLILCNRSFLVRGRSQAVTVD